MTDPSEWPKAVAAVGGMIFFCFALSVLVPYPWVILAGWLEERMKIKRILAEARLQEAKNAACPRRTEETKPPC